MAEPRLVRHRRHNEVGAYLCNDTRSGGASPRRYTYNDPPDLSQAVTSAFLGVPDRPYVAGASAPPRLRNPQRAGAAFETVAELAAAGAPARCGKGTATVLDPSVRDTVRVAPEDVIVEWDGAAAALETLSAVLDQPRLAAELHDVLVYTPGSFFKEHRDSKKHPQHVMTLAVDCGGVDAGAAAPAVGGDVVFLSDHKAREYAAYGCEEGFQGDCHAHDYTTDDDDEAFVERKVLDAAAAAEMAAVHELSLGRYFKRRNAAYESAKKGFAELPAEERQARIDAARTEMSLEEGPRLRALAPGDHVDTDYSASTPPASSPSSSDASDGGGGAGSDGFRDAVCESLAPRRFRGLGTWKSRAPGDWCAWYTAVPHKVRTVQSGCRVVAVYNLLRAEDGAPRPPTGAACERAAVPPLLALPADALQRLAGFLPRAGRGEVGRVCAALRAACGPRATLDAALRGAYPYCADRALLGRSLKRGEALPLQYGDLWDATLGLGRPFAFVLQHQYSADGRDEVPLGNIRGRDAVLVEAVTAHLHARCKASAAPRCRLIPVDVYVETSGRGGGRWPVHILKLAKPWYTMTRAEKRASAKQTWGTDMELDGTPPLGAVARLPDERALYWGSTMGYVTTHTNTQIAEAVWEDLWGNMAAFSIYWYKSVVAVWGDEGSSGA
eukprot:TRINITY_DN29758_c0_g1_i1.p1 TRINITY_DN29758_c0_g1~~TRINITY_DN29758_c0_g1_i1.p1  ORF type:complete len:668 (+),score=172.50 TRINITY_DN29758_c0_g1_i1:53-2056(+)